MNLQLLIGTSIIVLTAIFHIVALVYLAKLLQRIGLSPKFSANTMSMIFLMGVAVLVVIGIHTVEAWGWALVYYLLGEFNEIAQALYFSVVTSTTLGYGDVTLSKDGRLVGSFEAMGGLILFGAGTAFLLRVVGHLFQDARVQSAASD